MRIVGTGPEILKKARFVYCGYVSIAYFHGINYFNDTCRVMQDIQENSRREYQARINRVMDYIDAHIAEPLDLSVLAAEAHFSQFHFHRLFVVMTGETPVGFLQRIRLEKAARYLQMNDGMPISEIAVCCGFSDASSFSRAFRRHFGMTASQMRGRPRAILIKEGVRYSKQGKMVSNNCQAATPLNSDLCPVELKNLIFMETKIEIKQMPDFRVIYVRHTGEFHGISKAYEKLSRWAGPRGLMKDGR